jgi:hypothetical protein
MYDELPNETDKGDADKPSPKPDPQTPPPALTSAEVERRLVEIQIAQAQGCV